MGAPYIGSYGALGYAKEATFGTALAATGYVPFKDTGGEKDPGLFDIKLARQQRELTSYVAAGEQKITMPYTSALFGIMGMPLVVGAVGVEQYATGSTPTAATTLSSTATAGTTVVRTAVTFSVNDIVQVDVAANTNSELRKVTAVAGAGPYTVTLDSALLSTHSNGATVAKVVAPYTHNIIQSNNLTSFTIEENLGGLTALQWTGAVPTKLTCKGTTKTEAEATLNFMAQCDAQISPTTPVYSADHPFVLAGTQVTILGTLDTFVENFEFSVDNVAEERYGYSGNRYPYAIVSKGRSIEIKVAEALQSMSYYTQLASATSSAAPPSGTASIQLTSGADIVTFSFPQVSIKKLTKPQKVGETIMTDITLKAWLGSLTNSMTMTVVSSQYLPY